MNKLVIGPRDTVKERLGLTAFFKGSMTDEVDGPDGAKEIAIFVTSFEGAARHLGREFQSLLADNESDFVQVAGRLKYVGGSLEILKTCGKVSATMDGLCREVAKICMANIYGEVEVLKDTLEATKIAARAHHIDEPAAASSE